MINARRKTTQNCCLLSKHQRNKYLSPPAKPRAKEDLAASRKLCWREWRAERRKAVLCRIWKNKSRMFESVRYNLRKKPVQTSGDTWRNETITHCATGPKSISKLAPALGWGTVASDSWSQGFPHNTTGCWTAPLQAQQRQCQHQGYPGDNLDSNPRANVMYFNIGKEKPRTRCRFIRTTILLFTLFQNKFLCIAATKMTEILNLANLVETIWNKYSKW